MKINRPSALNSPALFYQLDDFIDKTSVHIKLEGFNISGSIKLKTASRLIQAIEEKTKLTPGLSTIICSSSGNLGIALSILCKEKEYPFICITDPNISPISEQYIQLYGGKIIKVTSLDKNGGYLETRLNLIEQLLAQNKHYIFADQYKNIENINAHYLSTAPEIYHEFERVDYLFVGAGTTGTLMGCAKFFKHYSPHTKIIAVDAVGSVTFGFPAAKRNIPGLGTSLKPSIVDEQYIDGIILINEIDTIKTCHQLLQKNGVFLGGSSGTVLAGVRQYEQHFSKATTVVAISPDFGDRYLTTIYNNSWLAEKFPSILESLS